MKKAQDNLTELSLQKVSGRTRLRRLGSQALYSLPAQWQNTIKTIKRNALGQYDWAASIRRLRLSEAFAIKQISAQGHASPHRKRIAIYSLHHYSPVEYGLGMALHLRGHDVQGILCNGLLPLCEMNLGPNIRPPCEACIMNLSRLEDAFGFNYERLQDYLTTNDLKAAEELVANTHEDALESLEVNGIPVGLFAHREIQRYYRGFIFEPARDPAFRKWLVSAVLLTWLSQRWLDKTKPDIVGVCSGRTLSTAPVFELAKQRGIKVVTWDGVATRPDGLMFAHNESATEIPLDSLWQTYRDVPLSQTESNELTTFMGSWARSEVTPFPYNLKPVEDRTLIQQQLGLRPEKPLIVAFTNTSWDIAIIDRDVGFDSMFDWLFSFVELATNHADMDFVVRAHPAEKKVPAELQSRSPVCAEIRKRFTVPPNLKLIEGDDPTSSYTLSNLAQVNMLYASRLGLEIALQGKRPWIAGAVTYRDKGFTLDLKSKSHMVSLLKEEFADQRLSENQIQLAQRFAYLWFFRYEVKLPILHPPDKRFALKSFSELGPGGDPAIEGICHSFVSGKPFVGLSNNQSVSAGLVHV